MKTPLVVLLLASLAANAALALFALRQPETKSATPLAAAPAEKSPATAAPAAATPAAPASGTAANWQAMRSSGDLHGVVANLRAAGFPPYVVRAIVSQMVSDQLRPAMDHLPFWKQNPNNPEYLAASQQAALRRKEMMNDLLGADARHSAMLSPEQRERRYGSLSDDKIDKLEALNEDYNQLRTQLNASRKAGDPMGVMTAQRAAEQEQRAELAAILTPAELEQYEMRSSPSSSRVISNIKGIEVSEAEYAALFRAQQAYDNADPLRQGITTPDAMAQRYVAQDKLNEQARAVLTDDRFYEYLKTSDSNYARIAQFTESHPAITPAMTYELLKLDREYQAGNMAMVRTTPENRQNAAAAMGALRQEYQEKVNSLLGQEIGGAYLQRNRAGGANQVMRIPGS